MHIFRRFIFGLALVLLSTSLLAEYVVKVNAMNYPARVIRNHQILALMPGFQFRAGDLLRTGQGGRVLLQLADGGAIKLGESARFLVDSAGMKDVQGETYPAPAFQVLRGAFRYSSSIFGNASATNHFYIKIGAVTTGVRSADVWGSSSLEQDLVALIEGAITIDADEESRVILEQALDFYVKPKGEARLPVAQVDPDQLQHWMNKTELDEAVGIAAQGGEWSLVLVSLTDMTNVERAIKDFHEKGFAVQRKSVVRAGKTLHRLLLPGFVSIQDAVNARSRIADNLGIDDAWVWRIN